jgi:hypothetical protein
MENFYRKNKSNVGLFESHALQLVSFSFSGRLLTQAKKQGGNALGGRFNQPLTYSSF